MRHPKVFYKINNIIVTNPKRLFNERRSSRVRQQRTSQLQKKLDSADAPESRLKILDQSSSSLIHVWSQFFNLKSK
ncbi:hypothetical protein, partial [Microcoleus sp. K4-C2]|uniref:hypothetical protein n=1 Tax=Microcoleus sp. K4-C2 TaxID=2818792 RepID=UPI002FD7835C